MMNLSAELSLSCDEARLFGTQILSEDVETVMRYFSIGIHIVLFPFSICLTSFTIFLILKFKHLRQTTFLLAMQLLILDLVVVASFVPSSILGALQGQWIMGLPFCRIFHAEFAFTLRLREGLMFIFVCDRFCTVFVPLRYPKYRKRTILSLFAVVLIFTIISLMALWTLNCSGFNRRYWICLCFFHENCPGGEYCLYYISVQSTISAIFGNVLPMVMYTGLFIKAKKVHNRIVPAGTAEDGEQRKRDIKVNLTFFAIFLSLFGLSLPPVLFFVLFNHILIPLGVEPPELLHVASNIMINLIWIIPITDSIAILRNPEVRKATKMLKSKLRLWALRGRRQEANTDY